MEGKNLSSPPSSHRQKLQIYLSFLFWNLWGGPRASLTQQKAKMVCISTFHLHCFLTLLLERGVGVGLLLPFLYLCGAATCPPPELFGDLARWVCCSFFIPCREIILRKGGRSHRGRKIQEDAKFSQTRWQAVCNSSRWQERHQDVNQYDCSYVQTQESHFWLLAQ